MSGGELLQRLERQGIELWFEGRGLRFRAPRGALGPEDRAQLAARRDEVIEQLRIRASGITTVHPQSFSQRSLWFLHQQAPDSAAYHVAMSACVNGPIDVGALRHALQALVDRHAVLRTTYGLEAGVPVQRVVGSASASFTLHDARGLERRALRELVEADYRRPFDLEHGPVFRASLYTSADDDHVLLLTVHHIAADGWSLLLALEELGKLYAEAAGGAPAGLPRAEMQYSDYVAWQERLLAGPEGERLWAYWRDQLAELPTALDLPTDRMRPALQGFRGGSVGFELDAPLSERLRLLARQEGTTLFVVLLAGFDALLHRLSGTPDVIVGTPVFGRNNAALTSVVGDFVNSVPVRARMQPPMSVRALIAQLRETMLGALDAQEFPLPLLVQRLAPRRDSNRSPLFDTFFVLQRFDQFRELERLLAGDEGDDPAEFGGLHLSPYPLAQQEGQFDLALQMIDRAGRLLGVMKYDTDLFDAATIERVINHYRSLLQGFVENPDARIDELPMLSDAELRRLLVEWNATAAQYPREQTVHGLFEAQAMRVPEAEAVRFGGQSLSYAQLNERSNRLARHLRELGVGAESLVGVWMERSADMVVALLGILKAGGAYVPLDPAFPKDRIDYMVSDAGLRVVVTQQDLAGALDESLVRVRLDADWPLIAQQATANLPALSGARNLAYVIYTSGSTGRPKGVQLEHRSVVNFLCSMHREPGLREGDRLVSVTTLSFDIAGLEIHGPLTVGATVVLASRTDALDGVRLAGLLQECGATILQATPATWRLLLESGWRGRAGLKMLCGGEALPRELAQKLSGLGGELWNLYGPTETTIWSTLCRVDETSRTIPIGRPIANTQLYVLEPSGLPAPIGVAGELCIGGDGLARGYRDREELTAEKFVSVALPEVGTVRVYRTGDLARYRADGQLEFVGRRDHQVKVRGFRIELGEIEASLGACPGVGQAVVDARVDHTGTAVLVAYVVPGGRQSVSGADLRQTLRQSLPDYMVPQYFVQLEALPLTPNGKIDRKALPAPEAGAIGEAQAFVEARTPTEVQVATIFRELLGVERVGAHSDFFDLGGHSLLAVRLMSKVDATFKVGLPLQTLFETPTVRDLARRIEQVVSGARDAGASGVPATTGTAGHTSRPIARLPRRAGR